jgi:hypothetical protein
MRGRWVAIYGVYGAVVLLYAVVIALEADSVRTRVGEAVAFAVVPAVVFVACALPLQRGWRSRVLLVIVALLGLVAGFVLAAASWGAALPLSFGLWALAVADLEHALRLSGVIGGSRVLVVGAVLVVAGAFAGLAAPVAAVALVAGVAVVAWKLVSTRRGGREILPPSRRH